MQINLYLCTNFTTMNTPISPELVSKAHKVLAEAQHVVIFTHMGPDGDAIGSSLALRHYLESRSTATQATVIVPNDFPDFLAWMPGADQILVYEGHAEQCDRCLDEADVVVCLDFNDPRRIGPVGERVQQKPCPKVMIDHHLYPTDFATVLISDPAVSSTCELVYYFLRQWEGESWHPSPEIANCLYTGLMTDTGNFSYNSNRPELYEIIAELMRAGIQKDVIYDRVFNQYSADRMRLMGYCLYKKMRLYPEHHMALITLSIDELKQFNYKQGDTEGIVNLPLQMGDIFYSVFMREQEPKPGTTKNVVKVSFRSQGDRPVNVMAAEVFRGGGHANASGGDFYGSIHTAARLFLREYPKYFKKE